MITITGNTFAHKETLKRYGARWDSERRVWTVSYLTPNDVALLRSLPGVMVTEPQPARQPDPPKLPRARTFHRSGEPIIIGDDPTYLNMFADKDPIAHFGFSSLAALCDHIESLERPDDEEPGMCSIGWRDSERGAEFAGSRDMAHAIELARYGWTEGLGIAEAFDVPIAEGKRRVNVVAVGAVNVGRMLAGNPTHMMRRVPQPKNKRITLFVELVMWRGINAKDAMLRALLIASIIDQLEAQNFMCAVYGVGTSLSWHDRDTQSTMSVKLKDFGERLSLLDLSFGIGHPSMLRRFKFAMEGVIPEIDIDREFRGIVSQAFDDTYEPGPNEFYFRQLPSFVHQDAYSNPTDMLRFILPKGGLPIELRIAS